ncbi:LodA/GoxA family CTQ-dependent oxidase [Archangium violaceum]|uniref:LodA/GoxA family CTQ-dependent oxidase n=1 Tax=Archangium violaceum TaxID=83451 RepID=UPI000B33B73D|nr:LodA/GoxA family CTQ-dependent oxidase [Archangium violaceum]
MKHFQSSSATPQRNVSRADCAEDPIASLEQMFVDQVQAGRIEAGQCPAMRPVFLKPHGVARGEFVIRPDLPESLRVGLFAGTAYPAWVRFSSDTLPTRNDWETTCGVGIKLFDTPIPKIFGQPDETTFDFILQNIDVFFVDTAREFCEFTQASLDRSNPNALEEWLKAHPRTQEILDQMQRPVASCLGTAYWSCLPFAFGPERYVKYKLEPARKLIPPSVQPADPTYLARDLERQLSESEQRFTFMIQLRTHPETMPLDAATVAWPESESPYVPVAELILPKQDITRRGQPEYGENMAWNIWRVTREHEPQGSIAAARKVVYAASAALRRNTNGIPDGEPANPKPLMDALPCKDTRIAYAKVHPGIGVCRVGDAETAFFLSPETDQIQRRSGDFYRDETGALKREAQRFRLYGYNAAGEVVSELNSDNADITWTVHLVNRKADWFQFVTAMDIPETKDLVLSRRNPKVQDRSILIIDPGPRSISGASVSGGAEHAFDTGEFTGVKVPLGSLRTDEKGRLIVLGGHGRSASPTGKSLVNPGDPNWFNNSNDWYDDTSDGPVTAEVEINGERIPVTGGWCVVAPPNYSPDTVGWRTMYDLMTDTAIQAGMMKVPPRTSFQRDVLPQLSRMSNLQWVNKGFAAFFGAGGAMDFQTDTALLGKLAMAPRPDPANPSKQLDPYRELRQNLYNSFRPYTLTVNDPRVWPWIYGDAFDGELETETSPRTMLAVPPVQLLHLQRWVAGNFEGGYDPGAAPPASLDDLPLAEQPAMLDKAALFFCLADAFHPGCELTWPMRHATMYREPYRLRAASPEDPAPTFEPTLSQAQALAPNGPLTQQSPGDITRWMGLPWQGDTAYCRAGYSPSYDEFLPTFWPARVPNNVLTEADYEIVMDQNKSREERLTAFNRRVSWNRFMDEARRPGDGPEVVMQEMVKTFGAQGLVARVPGPKDDPDFPEVMYVETLPQQQVKVARLMMAKATAPGAAAQQEANFRAGDHAFRQAVINLRSRRGDKNQE